jgi:hypothetical protein
MTRPKIIVHNHFRKPARDANGVITMVQYSASGQFIRKAPLNDTLATIWRKQIPNGRIEIINYFEGLEAKQSKDNWYHTGQVNGYYILEGAMGDKGRFIVRNGKYDIVKNASSKAEAVSFAKKSPHGGIQEMAQAADSGPVNIVHNKLLGGWYVVTGPHQTPISGKFNSREEARAWLDQRSRTGRPSGGLLEAGLNKFQR